LVIQFDIHHKEENAMNTKRFGMFVVLGLLGLTLTLLWLLTAPPPTAHAIDLTVCPAGPPDCGYAVIQDAVDAASDGDVIKIATGIYTAMNNYGGLAQVVYISKTVTIRGGYIAPDFAEPPDPEANPTTLDAQGQGRVFYITGNISPTIEKLRITGGDASAFCGIGTPKEAAGGGIFVDSADALIVGNIITDNLGGSFGCAGGGLCLRNTTAATLLQGNTIVENSGGDWGGGLAVIDGGGTISGNLFSNNFAFYSAGGAYLSLLST
jgi:hypothetical protein